MIRLGSSTIKLFCNEWLGSYEPGLPGTMLRYVGADVADEVEDVREDMIKKPTECQLKYVAT